MNSAEFVATTVAVLHLLSPSAQAAECLFINGNRPANEVYSFLVRDGDVPLEIPGSPFPTGGRGGVHRSPDTLAVTGDVLLALNSGGTHAKGSISTFRIGDGCFLASLGVFEETPGSSQSMLLERSQRFVYVTNFEEGSISAFERTDGELLSLGTTPTPLSRPLDIVQDEESGIVFVSFRNALGFGLFEVEENGGLSFQGFEGSGLHWGLVPPGKTRRLYSFELSGPLNGHNLGSNGVLAPLPNSPWFGHFGTNDLIFSPRNKLLLSISDSLRAVGTFRLNSVGVPLEAEWSPTPVPAISPRGLVLSSSEKQLFVVSLNRLTTFSISENGLTFVEPQIALPTGEKSAALSYVLQDDPVSGIPVLERTGFITLCLLMVLSGVLSLNRVSANAPARDDCGQRTNSRELK